MSRYMTPPTVLIALRSTTSSSSKHVISHLVKCFKKYIILGNGTGKSEISKVIELNAFRHEFDNGV